jgi:hypothetical protein
MRDDAEAAPEVVSPDPVAAVGAVVRRPWVWGSAVVLVAVLAAAGVLFRHSLSWGDVPTWVAAVTTFLAFVAAGFAGVVAYELLRVENARDEAARVERRQAEADRAARWEAAQRAQASEITAWFGSYKGGVPRDQYYPGSPDVATAPIVWGAVVRNASRLPVFDVQVVFYEVNDPGGTSVWTPKPRWTASRRFRVIPPDQTRRLDLPQTVLNTDEECNDDVFVVGVTFTDANGVRWMRDARGALVDPNRQV